MSIREVTYYQIECDWPDCTHSTADGPGEFSAWSDDGGAEEEWLCDGGVIDGGKHLCEKHAAGVVCQGCGQGAVLIGPRGTWCDQCIPDRSQ